MNSYNSQDDFEPDDFEEDTSLSSKDDFEPDDFEPEKNERKYEDLNWFEKEFTPEGGRLKADLIRNNAKALLSGATAGWSEYGGEFPENFPDPYLKGKKLKGFEVEDRPGSSTHKFVGSLLPIEKGIQAVGYAGKGAKYALEKIGVPLAKMIENSPKLQKPITALGNLLGLSATLGTHAALEESSEKSIKEGKFIPPTIDDVIKHGEDFALLDIGLNALGWTGRFTKALFSKAKKLEKPVMEVLKDTISESTKKYKDKFVEKALSILEDKPMQQIEKEIKLSQKEPPTKTEIIAQERFQSPEESPIDISNKKVSKKDFGKLEEGQYVDVKPYLPEEMQTEKIVEEAIDNDITKRIDDIASKPASETEFGNNIKNDIEYKLKEDKKEIDKLYEEAKTAETSSSPNLEKSATSVVEAIQDLQKGNLKLTPEGYAKAEKDLLNTLNDLGYDPILDELGNLEGAVLREGITLDQAIEVKKRLNKIIDYDLLETSAGDKLKNPASKLREDIREGYGKNTQQRKAYEKAEEEYEKWSERKNRKSIKNIRKSEKPETISKSTKTPSGLRDVKEVVTPEQFAQIERDVIEHIRSLPESQAEKYYREVRDVISPENRSLVEEIIQNKAPKSSPIRRQAKINKIEETLFDELDSALLTGEKPRKTLDNWKTEEGQKIIKNALEGNPNKEEVIKYLSDQSFIDFTSSFIDSEGKVNFKEMNNLLKDPATLNNIRIVSGEDGVAFFKQLEHLSERISKNANMMEKSLGKSTEIERKKMMDEMIKRGKERIKRQKERNLKTDKSKTGKVFSERFDKQSIKNLEEQQESLEKLGKERFRKAREKRKALTEQEKAAQEASEKTKFKYIFDTFMKDYGFKTKGLIFAMTGFKLGLTEAFAGAAAYETIMFLAKNPRAREAYRKAAGPWVNPVKFISSIDKLSEELLD